jgi:hypothetical protein
MVVNYNIIEENIKRLEIAKDLFGGEIPNQHTLTKFDLKQYIDFDSWSRFTLGSDRKIIYDTLDFKTVKDYVISLCKDPRGLIKRIKPLGQKRFNKIITDSDVYDSLTGIKYQNEIKDSTPILMNWAIQQKLDVGIHPRFPAVFYTRLLPTITDWHLKLYEKSKELEGVIKEHIMSFHPAILHHIDVDSIFMKAKGEIKKQITSNVTKVKYWKCIFEAPGLTIGKTYEVDFDKTWDKSQVYILNDDGVNLIYSMTHFIPADLYRDDVLTSLFG